MQIAIDDETRNIANFKINHYSMLRLKKYIHDEQQLR